MKFTDEQKEVLELLPTNVKETNELTDAAKLILANLMYLNGTDFAKNEGYLFRTNQALMQDTGIKSEKTIIAAVNKLIEFGFIERKAGQRKSASEYRLNTVKMNEYTVKIHCKNEKYSNKLQDKNYSNKLQYKEKNTVINYSNDNNETILIINGLQETIKKLQDKIAVMGDELLQYKNYSIKNYSENKNYSTDIDIDKETDTISKDNLLNNDNTEGRNSKEKNNIKEKYTKDNLEKLKENSNDEIFNDEDIQRENESLNEDKDNISKVKSSNNENLNESRISDLVDMYFNQTNIPNDNIPSESRIPSEDNISTDENPNDMPPLDVDCFFENNSNQPTEYRDNENLNESRIPSEDGRIETRDNISDNENSKADEIDCSVFGNETFDSDTISKTQNLVPRCVDGRFVVVEDNISNDENSKNNNLKTSENMKKTKISKGEISNKSNISNEGKISKKANSSNSFIHFGRLVGVCDMKGNVEEYLFNAYDTLKTADDFSEKFTETTEITIDLTQLEVTQDCGSGVWGMLSFNNGEYSFTQSNVNTQYSEKVTQSCAAETAETSNNVPQGDETSKVDNHTADGEKVAPEQPQIANKASESNNDTTANDKEDEKATEMPNADENTDEVDNNTTDKEITAGSTLKMRPEPSYEKIDTPTDEKKDENTKREPSGHIFENPWKGFGDLRMYARFGDDFVHVTGEGCRIKEALEYCESKNDLKGIQEIIRTVTFQHKNMGNYMTDEYYNDFMRTVTAIQASISSKVGNNTTDTKKTDSTQSPIANKESENNAAPLPNSIKAWEKVNIYSHIDKKTYTMNEGFEIYKALSAKDIHSLMTWMKDFCDTMRMAKDNNIITEEQFNDFHNVFNALSRGKKKYWYNAFSNREPRKTMTSEMQMWEYLGKPKVNNKADNKTVDNNKVYEDNVILPTDKDFESKSLDEIKNTLLTFVAEHPNLSDDKKAYVNNLCIAYALEPQYVA